MNQAVNAIHIEIPVAFVNHILIGPQTERRKKQPARQRMRKRIERESNQPAKERVNETGDAPVPVHEGWQPAKSKGRCSNIKTVLTHGAIKLKPAFDTLGDCQNKKRSADTPNHVGKKPLRAARETASAISLSRNFQKSAALAVVVVGVAFYRWLKVSKRNGNARLPS